MEPWGRGLTEQEAKDRRTFTLQKWTMHRSIMLRNTLSVAFLSSPRRSCSYSGQKSNSSVISRTSAGRNGLQPKRFFGTETRGKCAQPPFLKFLFRGQQTLLLKLLMFLSSADRQQWFFCLFVVVVVVFCYQNSAKQT